MPQCQQEPWGLIVKRGATWVRVFELLDAPPPGGAPINLANCSAQLIAKDQDGGNIVLANLVGVIDAGAGTITFTISKEETAVIPIVGLPILTTSETVGYSACGEAIVETITGPTGVYDIPVTYADGTVDYIAGGNFSIGPQV